MESNPEYCQVIQSECDIIDDNETEVHRSTTNCDESDPQRYSSINQAECFDEAKKNNLPSFYDAFVYDGTPDFSNNY